MRRFVLVSCDFVKTGGMDRANYALASYLARGGNEVHAVAHRASGDLCSHSNFIFHPVRKPLGSYFLGERLLDRAGRGWARRVAGDGSRVLVNGGNCTWGDTNWVHYVHAAYEPDVRTGLMRRLKSRMAHRSFLKSERDALGRARIIFANSERTRRDLIERLGISPDRIRTIYYGIDPESFRPATTEERIAIRRELTWNADQPVVAFIGALGDRRKGFDVLFEAWHRLSQDRGWDARLAVIGRGAELRLWDQRAMERGLDDSIEFMGFRKDVPRILRACDALVAPTRYEAYGLGVQEALACGVPALVSASAGVAERYAPFADELGDLLLPDADNVDDLVERLRAWRRRRDHYAAAISPLTTLLRSYTWDDMASDMLRAWN